jgi:hypothetical protein
MKFGETIIFSAVVSVQSSFDRLLALNGRAKWLRNSSRGLEGIRDWKIHAGIMEIEAIDLELESEKQLSGGRPGPCTRQLDGC